MKEVPMAVSEAQKRATAKYIKHNVKRYVVQLNKNTDEDLVCFMESIDNVNGFSKDCIRKAMEESKK